MTLALEPKQPLAQHGEVRKIEKDWKQNRRALAQSVSDPRPLEREPKQHNFNNCFNTFCFYTCLSFQQSTIVTNPFSFYNDSTIQSVFHTNFEPSPLFSAKISNSASTVAQTTVSCLYSAHARLPLREPPGIGIGGNLRLTEHFFLKQFLERIFFTHTNHMFVQK